MKTEIIYSRICSQVELIFSISVISLSIVTLLIGVLVPIYSDEVAMLLARARVISEGGNLVSLFPQCGESFVSPLPLMFWPPATLYSLVFGNLSLFGIRLVGVFFGLLWFGGLAFFCIKFFQQRKDALTCFGAICAVSFLGVLPFVWVLARTENVLIICILFLTGLSVFSKPGSRLYVKAFGIVFASALMLYVHPKALFFVPFMVLAAYFGLSGASPKLKIAAILLIAAIAAQTLITTRFLMECGDAPQVRLALSYSALSLSLLFDSPVVFFEHGLSNLISMPERVVAHILFANTYQSGWLPQMQSSELLGSFNLLVALIIKFVVAVAIFGGVLKFFTGFLCRHLNPRTWLAMGLSVGLAANAILYNAWHFYGAQQVIAIALVVWLLIFVDVTFSLAAFTMIRSLGSILMATALVSLVILNLKMTPGLVRSATSEIYPLPNQPLSVPHLNQSHHFETIRDLAKKCGVSASGSKNLVVDHMTYFAFSGLKQPIHIAYVSEYAYGGDLLDGRLVPFLKKLGTTAAIATCAYMSPQFKQIPGVEKNGYCCFSFERLDVDQQTVKK